jgi:alkyldihydroxyacetonephosphate synthase
MGLARVIRDAVGVQASESAPDKISYSRDLWPRHHIAVRDGRVAEHKPAAIAWPESTEQVAALLSFCGQEGIQLVPFGAGSGVCGGVLPTDKTLVVDLKRMKRWRKLAVDDGYLEVEAGVQGIRLEEELQAKGYTIGHFPSSILCSTVGGWIAARGAGQMSGLYGKIEDMTAAIECVDGRGEVALLKRRNRGPDLTPLIVGSEGVLAVITAARLRLHNNPTKRAFGAWSFDNMEAGYETIRMLYQRGLRPAVCRLYDPFDSMMARRSANKKRGGKSSSKSKSSGVPFGSFANTALRLPAALNFAVENLGTRAFGGAMLVLVFEGTDERPDDELAVARDLARDGGGEDLGEGPARHWLSHRYAVSYRQAPMFMMGAFVDTMEVAAPWSKLGGLYDGVREALGDHVMVMAHMSHAYPDGCSIYFTFAGSADDNESAERRYDEAWRAAMQASIAAGATLSHHHGVGRSKAPQMGAELGLGIEVVAAVRKALDPQNILNPGNLMPAVMPPRTKLPPAPARPTLDWRSQTVRVAGTATLSAVDAAARVANLSLSLPAEVDLNVTVNDWLADGAPGAPDPWLDPVDHLVSGYEVELPSGDGFEIRPCPRRAVGPDLWSIFFGTNGRAGRIHSVHLRVRADAPTPIATPIDRNPPIDDVESRWIDRAIDATANLT